jgi:hypothetical protein
LHWPLDTVHSGIHLSKYGTVIRRRHQMFALPSVKIESGQHDQGIYFLHVMYHFSPWPAGVRGYFCESIVIIYRASCPYLEIWNLIRSCIKRLLDLLIVLEPPRTYPLGYGTVLLLRPIWGVVV